MKLFKATRRETEDAAAAAVQASTPQPDDAVAVHELRLAPEGDPQQEAVDAAIAALRASGAVLTGPFEFSGAFFRGAKPSGPLHSENEKSASGSPDERGVATRMPERVQRASESRPTLRTGMAELRKRERADVEAIRTALENADAASFVTAVESHALGLFLDENCGRPGTLLHGISTHVENELVAAIYADPEAVLDAGPGDAPDSDYIRSHAIAATTLSPQLFDSQGQPSLPRPPSLSLNQTMVPR